MVCMPARLVFVNFSESLCFFFERTFRSCGPALVYPRKLVRDFSRYRPFISQALHEIADSIHIDLKPRQFFVGDGGRVVLNDFNSARVTSTSPGNGMPCPARSTKRNKLAAWPSPENYAGQVQFAPALNLRTSNFRRGPFLFFSRWSTRSIPRHPSFANGIDYVGK